jgi:hypothetical protein
MVIIAFIASIHRAEFRITTLDHFPRRTPVRVPVSPRTVARSAVHEGSLEAFGAALLLLELSDSEETNDSDYTGGNGK